MNNRILVGTWFGALLVVGYKSFHSGSGMPPPKSLLATNVVWTLLSLLSLASEELAGVLSVGALLGLGLSNSALLGTAASAINPAPTMQPQNIPTPGPAQ